MTQDDAGRIYRNTNESALHVDLVPTAYYARNPNLLRTRGSYERLADDNQRPQHRLAGAAESRNQPRLSDRHRSRGRLARQVHGRVRAAGVSRRSPARRALRQRLRRGARRQPRQPDHPERRRRRRCGRERRTSAASSWRRPTSASVRSTCRTRPTARCTSSTCIAASSSTAFRSPCTCAIRSSRASWISRPASGRIYRVVHDTTGATRRAIPANAAAGAAGRHACRIRTAGGATPRSGCWSNAAPGPPFRRSCKLAEGREGPAYAPARALDARRHRRHPAGHGGEGAGGPARDVRQRRSGSPNDGWASRTIRFRPQS